MARPKLKIDWPTLDKLLELNCSTEDCAYFFACSVDTLERRVKEAHGLGFAEYKHQKSVRGRINLRRKQFEVAMQGNTALLIFLGKQWLGQSDKAVNPTVQETIMFEDYSLWDLKDPSA